MTAAPLAPPASRLRAAALLLALAVVGGVATAGCGAARSGAGAEVGSCATTLPRAFAVVRGHGTLLELRRITDANPAGPARALTPAQRQRRARRRNLLHRMLGSHPASVCLAVFRGTFSPGSVVGSSRGGRYALVLLLANPLRVLHVAVLQWWPPRQGPGG